MQRMAEDAHSSRQRVSLAINHQRPDRVPRDFAAVPEVWEQLSAFFGTTDRGRILDALGVDCRVVSYDLFCSDPDADTQGPSGGAWRTSEADNSYRDIWGAHRMPVKNSFGALDQFASFPLAHAETTNDLQAYRWPSPAWWDFSALRDLVARISGNGSYNIRYRIGAMFETAWSLIGFEKAQLCLAMNPGLLQYMMERITEVHEANLQQVLDTCSDEIDVVYFYDDVASQNSLLMSPEMYASTIQPYHRRIIELATRYGKPVMMHC